LTKDYELIDTFSVKKRCRHVLKEGERVNRSAEYLKNGYIKQLARQMNESHLSCRDDYEISCKEVNELAGQCVSHGAEAARITGAGFGGSVVCLVHKNKLKDFTAKIKRTYYEEYIPEQHPELKTGGDNIVISRSVDGAGRLL
jgi:galactokinase